MDMTGTAQHIGESTVRPHMPAAARVTLIDDSDEFAELLSEALERLLPDAPCAMTVYNHLAPFEVLVASQPDLIIIDPHVGAGTEAWEAIGRAQAHPVLRDVPVIVCTAGSSVTSHINDGSRWRVQILPKPFAMDELGLALKGAGL
jgi:CheY-like chemotaxis protein